MPNIAATPPLQRLVHQNGAVPHILVVDDEPLIAQSIADLLSLAGNYRVSIAGNGHDALKQLEQSLYQPAAAVDVVLLDVTMPLVTGLDVLKWIRGNERLASLRVIMLTGVDDKREVIATLQKGADDYITKPYHPPELKARIQTALRTQQLEKNLARQQRQLANLNTITNEVARARDLNELLVASVKGLQELLNAEMTAIYLPDESRRSMGCKYLATNRDNGITKRDFPIVPIGQGVVGRAFTDRRTHIAESTLDDTRFDKRFDAPAGYDVRSIIAAPIYLRGHPFGVLVAINKQESTFATADADLFASLAGTMSQGVDNWFYLKNLERGKEEIQESHNTLQAIIDGILHPIYTIDADWRVVSINATQRKRIKTETGKTVGRRCYELFFERETPCDHCRAAKLQRGSEVTQWTVRWVGDDYLPREWDVNAYSLPGKSKKTADAVIVWQDRTEERRLENSLHQAAKLSAIGQLAAGVAHEINNPLTVIKTGAEMLQDTISPDSEDYELVEWIANASDRATKVVRGLLDFARQSRYEFEYGSITRSLEEAIDLVSYQLRKTEIEIVEQFEPGLPDIVASWEHLKSVWVNMLMNARDALEERAEGRTVTLVVRTASTGDHMQVLIRDNGSGMTEEQMARIFVPFFTTKDPGRGTGLGLATCHRIIDRHGGEITVSSKKDAGTTFIIRLPLSETMHAPLKDISAEYDTDL
jgi:two-component system NtrC family sensor kinase